MPRLFTGECELVHTANEKLPVQSKGQGLWSDGDPGRARACLGKIRFNKGRT
jgi:hypothetical protein